MKILIQCYYLQFILQYHIDSLWHLRECLDMEVVACDVRHNKMVIIMLALVNTIKDLSVSENEMADLSVSVVPGKRFDASCRSDLKTSHIKGGQLELDCVIDVKTF